MMSVKLDKAVFGYRSGFTMGPLSFSACDGDVVIIVGPNGSGKSTILRTIAGLHDLIEGEIQSGLSGENRPPILGWVSESRADLPGELSAREIWELTARLMAASRSGADEMLQRSDEMATAFELMHLDVPLRVLSHGTYKKVAIITALMARRRLLLFDEPTDGLDDASVHTLLTEIVSYKEGGPVQFIATHDPRLLKVADVEIRLDQSKNAR